jgi:hypothetical protein
MYIYPENILENAHQEWTHNNIFYSVSIYMYSCKIGAWMSQRDKQMNDDIVLVLFD